ncbi:MAG: 3'-5' exonuclease [Anaerolineales bacterium]|nr:3'-5' exonuclease [Anaerolineales bacterium]
MPNNETFISVDVETAGPNPGKYSLLSIGACLVFNPQEQFYVEIQPLNEAATAEALHISKLDLAELKERGQAPQEALARFSQWIRAVTPSGNQPVFVAFNAPFDWMFVNDYFHRYLGENPFGHKALDIKAYFMGMTGLSWHETGMGYLAKRYLKNQSLSHHALQDALDQAEIFRKMLAEDGRNRF